MNHFVRNVFAATLIVPVVLSLLLVFNSCTEKHTTKPGAPAAEKKATVTSLPDTTKPRDAAAILQQPQVPILCYHQIRDWRPTDSKTARDYIVPVDNFKAQLKLLADSGYHTILPDDLYKYLVYGSPLPARPVMLTFDDTDDDQYTIAWPEMKKYGFKGVFFVMTVSLGRPNYMTKEAVKELADAGNVIGSHTWDHHNVKKYTAADWARQVDKPTAQLQAITGKPLHYFAYPFGLWNKEAIPPLKQRGFKAAFQLSEKRDEQEPLYTIRRMIVPGSWTAAEMLSVMKKTFR
ncbi:MAG TPA: polysaccharide deacetylase family protein [Chitinophagaceae bacterium]|nr:polysaccharide deacetylase family protein [Chitinophagaceae bacterium]